MSRGAPGRVARGRRAHARGLAAEEEVAAHYAARGFAVADRRWRCGEGELDLVVSRGALVVFCEVKARTSDAYGAPPELVGPLRQLRIRRAAAAWLAAHPADARARRVRFDVACVEPGGIEVIEEAF